MQSTFFHQYIDDLYQKFVGTNEGAVADYIPDLAKVDPEQFGIALVTIDGHVYQTGDTREDFSIQSVSKAFTYGLILEQNGVDKVLDHINVEPSGEAFNSISLEEDSGRPKNPMINAGAIAATGLVQGDKVKTILKTFGHFAGRELSIDQSIYQSEKDTGHRNRAIAHMLKTYDKLSGDPEETLDAYFQQCSINVNCRDLAIMAATLANDGVNPITNIRGLKSKYVPNVLSVMSSCGMYDYSGNWIYSVGMPAKSGVGGGVLCVLPGQFGLAIFSPKLDAKGNSVRGIKVSKAFSNGLGLHMFHSTKTSMMSVIRSQYSLSQVRSKMQRNEEDQKLLDSAGQATVVFELMNDLSFISSEVVLIAVNELKDNCDYIIIDMSRVGSIDQAAVLLFSNLSEALSDDNLTVYFTGLARLSYLASAIKHLIKTKSEIKVNILPSIDIALETVETILLENAYWEAPESAEVTVTDQILFEGFNEKEINYFRSLMETKKFKKGDVVCKEGEDANEFFFIKSGRISVWIQCDRLVRRRLNAVGDGWVFGESAFLDGAKRTADIEADTDVELLSLDASKLKVSQSDIASSATQKLYKNLCKLLLNRLHRANNEIRVLA